LRFLIRTIGFTVLVKLASVEGLENVPSHGPAILMINHIAFVDPIVVLHLVPRNIVPMAKVEVYDYPVVGIFPRLWGVIPVRREEVDRRAIQGQWARRGEIIQALEVTHCSSSKEGHCLFIHAHPCPHHPRRHRGHRGFPNAAVPAALAWARHTGKIWPTVPLPTGPGTARPRAVAPDDPRSHVPAGSHAA
jgi:1-acyl-sn-glycerol-3-phosphate acyltransferase